MNEEQTNAEREKILARITAQRQKIVEAGKELDRQIEALRPLAREAQAAGIREETVLDLVAHYGHPEPDMDLVVIAHEAVNAGYAEGQPG